MGMSKAELLKALADIKSGKRKIEDVEAIVSATRGMTFEPANITKAADLKTGFAYFATKDGKIVSLPLVKAGKEGSKFFKPYYQSEKNGGKLLNVA